SADWIEQGISRYRTEKGGPILGYRVQLGRRGKGNRRSRICKTLEEAVALKKEWLERGLPVKGAPEPAAAVVATVDDGFMHRALDLQQQGKDPGVAERIGS